LPNWKQADRHRGSREKDGKGCDVSSPQTSVEYHSKSAEPREVVEEEDWTGEHLHITGRPRKNFGHQGRCHQHLLKSQI